MKLLTKDLLKIFKKIGSQDWINEDPIVICKFFNPTWAWTWYATEFNENEWIFYGYVSIFWDNCDEWWYFTLSELESFKWRFWLGIERDLFFSPTPFSKINK